MAIANQFVPFQTPDFSFSVHLIPFYYNIPFTLFPRQKIFIIQFGSEFRDNFM